MKFTVGWLKDHLDTTKKDYELIEKLTDVGLEVESFDNLSSDLDNFKVAKIINAEQHPNADRLRVCDVDIGEQNTVKVVCGATNAKRDLLTVYAGPGSIIPKNNCTSPMKIATAGIGSASVAKKTVQQPNKAIIIFILKALPSISSGLRSPNKSLALANIDSGVGIAHMSIKTRMPIPNHLKSVVLSKPPPDSFLLAIVI